MLKSRPESTPTTLFVTGEVYHALFFLVMNTYFSRTANARKVAGPGAPPAPLRLDRHHKATALREGLIIQSFAWLPDR